MKTAEKLVPQLRFSDYDNDWDKVVLENITSKISDGIHSTPKYDLNGDYYFVNGNNLVDGVITINENTKRVSLEEFKKHKRPLSKNSILLSINGTIGNLALYNNENIVLGKSACYINLQKDLPIDFYYYILQTPRIKKYFLSELTGSTIMNLSLKTIKATKLIIPPFPEQQKIAAFLTDVDDKITKLTKKKTLLEQYKKGVMQQLFNQELRFKDDEGNDFADWKEKKLKEFILNFIVPMRDKPKDLTGEIPWCRIEDFDGKYLSKSKSNQGVTLETVKKMNLKVYPKNTLLVSCSASLGFCAIVEKELITNQTFIGLYPDSNKVDVSFLYHIMKLSSRRLNVLSSGTTISYLSRKQFENFKIQFPCLKEQTKIANFLSDIDVKIEALNTKIENSKTFKKGLLQKMFV